MMTDHRAESENFMGAVIIPNGEPPEIYIAMAQVSATLALVEQQRIANRIALANMTHANGSRIGCVGGMETAIFDYGEHESSVRLKPEIREGLRP